MLKLPRTIRNAYLAVTSAPIHRAAAVLDIASLIVVQLVFALAMPSQLEFLLVHMEACFLTIILLRMTPSTLAAKRVLPCK